MPLFHRRDTPPAAVLALLASDERVVSWADTVAGSVVLATPRGLWWPGRDAYRLIGWQCVSRATWHESVLEVVEADVLDDLLLIDRAPVAHRLGVPRDLPPTVRTRVEANVVVSQVVQLPGGSARCVGRRVPGEDGLRWWARLEPGTADTPAVRSEVVARLALLRADRERRSSDQDW